MVVVRIASERCCNGAAWRHASGRQVVAGKDEQVVLGGDTAYRRVATAAGVLADTRNNYAPASCDSLCGGCAPSKHMDTALTDIRGCSSCWLLLVLGVAYTLLLEPAAVLACLASPFVHSCCWCCPSTHVLVVPHVSVPSSLTLPAHLKYTRPTRAPVVQLIVKPVGHLDGFVGVPVLHNDEVVGLKERPPLLQKVQVPVESCVGWWWLVRTLASGLPRPHCLLQLQLLWPQLPHLIVGMTMST